MEHSFFGNHTKEVTETMRHPDTAMEAGQTSSSSLPSAIPGKSLSCQGSSTVPHPEIISTVQKLCFPALSL